MTLSTYAELQADIASELFDRADSTAEIKRFIRIAEAQMGRDLRVYDMVKRATATIDARYTAMPSDHRESISLHLSGKHKALEVMSAQAMTEYRAYNEDVAGTPRFVCYVGEDFEVFPTPDESYTGELRYYAEIPALADDNTSNWLLAKHPDAYFYGALMAAGNHYADGELMKRAGAAYAAAVTAITDDSKRQQYPGPISISFKRGRQ